MYERNAVVLERYFNQMFGYNMKNNIKTNFEDYCELVDCLERYHNISEEEENVIQEYDSIANKIREIQKIQEGLNKKNIKLQEERASIVQNVGDNASSIQKKLDSVNSNIQDINAEIMQNVQKFVDVVSEFNDKSLTRTECGRNRRNIESEYNKKLNDTLDNYQDIDVELERTAKNFIEIETDGIEKEIREKIEKNGEKEKTPFNKEVLTKAISLSIDIQKRETDILANIYDKTNRLFTEIKNNAIRIDKHKKIIKDANCKLEFIAAIKEYLVQFLDNERLTAVNGEEEHTKLMIEACKNLDDDLVQINNLYTLLLKESSKKITKKSYPDLYNYDYLEILKTKSEKFDTEIKKLNLPVTIINPNHWRTEGMQKIYDTFIKCVTEIYDRDLREFMPHLAEEKEEEDDFEDNFNTFNNDLEQNKSEEVNNDESENEFEDEKKDAKAEIDKKIDMILGFSDLDKKDDNKNEEDDDDWDDEEDNDEDDDDEEDDDLIFNDEKDEDEDDNWDDDLVLSDDDEIESEDNEEDDDDDWDDDWDDDKKEDDNKAKNDDEVNLDIWGNAINSKDNEEDDDEEDDDDWDDEEDNDETDEDDDDLIFGDDEEDDDDEDDDDDWDDLDKKSKNKGKHSKDYQKNKKMNKKNKSKEIEDTKEEESEDWADEFVDIKNKNKKGKKDKNKKGFFNKFKK